MLFDAIIATQSISVPRMMHPRQQVHLSMRRYISPRNVASSTLLHKFSAIIAMTEILHRFISSCCRLVLPVG